MRPRDRSFTRRQWAQWSKQAALFISAPLLLGSTSLTSSFDARVLAAHNRERLSIGVAPLEWSDSLALSSQHWAKHLAATGTFQHAPERDEGAEGENLWEGTKGQFSVEAMVDGWIREKRFFKSGRFPDNSVTGRSSDIGHYTQLIWRQTHKVGCATAANQSDQYLVCRYSEAGNYIGDTPY